MIVAEPAVVCLRAVEQPLSAMKLRVKIATKQYACLQYYLMAVMQTFLRYFGGE